MDDEFIMAMISSRTLVDVIGFGLRGLTVIASTRMKMTGGMENTLVVMLPNSGPLVILSF
jgi:hypothetical protein